MPIYRFNFRGDDQDREDILGHDLASDEAALEEATIAAREVVIQRVRWAVPIGDEAYEVVNAEDKVINVVSLRSVIPLVPKEENCNRISGRPT